LALAGNKAARETIGTRGKKHMKTIEPWITMGNSLKIEFLMEKPSPSSGFSS